MNDPLIEMLKSLATNGDRGPLYDRGVMSVIAEVEANGFFVPNQIAKDIHSLQLDIKAKTVTESERQSAFDRIEELGMTIESAAEYSGGILYAESMLAHLAKR